MLISMYVKADEGGGFFCHVHDIPQLSTTRYEPPATSYPDFHQCEAAERVAFPSAPAASPVGVSPPAVRRIDASATSKFGVPKPKPQAVTKNHVPGTRYHNIEKCKDLFAFILLYV